MMKKISMLLLVSILAFSSFAVAAPKKSTVPRAIQVGTATLTRVYPRIITPNGDGWNDTVIFEFDNPAFLPLKGDVFDVTGTKVADLMLGASPDTQLLWDGKRNGRAVPGGVYIYKIQVGNSTVEGTVAVAQ